MTFESIKDWLERKWKKDVGEQANEITGKNKIYCKKASIEDLKYS